ncbi:MAG: hypothetical protein HC889_13440 [Synechococcaceae cyanobacterium SM1_2_3]|nr:hypothetical protein [Synechococcaceae cyanobacterium SM1_2_3]
MTTLDQILDGVMELPEDQQDMLVDIVQHRRLEARRKDIAMAASESLTLFHSGQLKPQSVEEIIEKLRYSLPAYRSNSVGRLNCQQLKLPT